MSTMQAEVFEAFRDMGAAEDKALKLDNASVKGELSTLRRMVGFDLTLTVLGFGSVLGFLWRFVT